MEAPIPMNPAAMNPADPLAALRDIHGPPAPGFWPPASGWTALAVLGIALALAAAVLAARWWRAERFRREALASLRSLRARHAAGAADTEIATELSALIRRVALARNPREEVAGLTGERWLAWLESTHPGMGDSASTALLDAPYAPRCRFDVGHALADCERWIRRA